ncbi:hypothetical protein PV02_04210 [Methanolobus chelungpuianus]|uniref:Polysaccharide deacetylase n=2 Tax=Methanolobus chelungpuianus TaxID=502115 RepID=A0AAE3KYV6_9EURY|nr:hypothetical protein [Methanolobus chelungpuianus]
MKYKELLETIKSSGYETTTVHDFLVAPKKKCIILRHDVDREVGRNLSTARLEAEYDIKSTYYFRHVKGVFIPAVIEEISSIGHEIGYHYEVLDKAKGDEEKAIQIFREELEDLRKYADVKTICMHGNPFASWSNRDLWNNYDFTEFGIIGEPYLSIDYGKVFYLTDTGRTWANTNIRVKDVVNTSYQGKINQHASNIRSTEDVCELIRSEEIDQICILMHPNRWCDNIYGWMTELVFQNIKNIGKAGIIRYRSKTTVR